MNRVYLKLKDFEIYHQAGLFVGVMLLTIILTRIGVLIYNPNPIIFDFEIHHFDYGLLLLFTTSLMMLFGSRKSLSNLILTAVAFGLILDEIWFIRGNIFNPIKSSELTIYNSTLPYVTVIIIFTAIIVTLIGTYSKKIKNKQNKLKKQIIKKMKSM